MKRISDFARAFVLLAFFGLSLVQARVDASEDPRPHSGWSFSDLGKVPVQSGGRIKPLDSLARETILFETGSRGFEGWNPLEMILSWVAFPHFWESKAFVRVNRDDVKRQLGLDESRSRFSPGELLNNPVLAQYAERMAHGKPQGTEPPGSAGQSNAREKELRSVVDRIGLFQSLAIGEGWRFVPKPAPAAWGSLVDLDKDELYAPIRNAFVQVLKAYQTQDQVHFEQASDLLRLNIEKEVPGYSENFSKVVEAEVLYNKTRPFLFAWILYLAAALLWGLRLALGQGAKIEKGAMACTALGICSHVFGFGLRCFVAGRPPVTNMYESIIWVSLGILFFALILYRIHRQPILLAVATSLAALGLISGDAAPAILDPSLNPLVPVLRSNYWLTVHVLTITLSYAAFALTFGLANISLYYFLRNARSQKTTLLNQLTYRAMQFGVVLIAAGTILGGIWADYSWGRFWGWDPKEVWALITLLCYLLILHGRYAGWVSPFGFAVWSAVSFLSVIMAWYGVNFILGVGLHSYGFSTGGTPWVLGFVGIEAVFILAVAFVVLYRKKRA